MGPLQAITIEDRELVKRYILLPLVIRAFERDSQIIQSGQIKTPDPYVDAISAAVKKANAELSGIKQKFFKKGLKVIQQKTDEDGIDTKFMCRGYNEDMYLRWEFISAQASILMRKYLGLDVTIFEDHSIPEHLRNKY